MAELYRQKVTTLAQALEHPETRTEASEALRGLDRRHRPDAEAEGEPQNRAERESGGDARARPYKCEEVARNRRPLAASSRWLRGRDLNPRPLGYEPNELPDCSTPRQPTDRNTPCRCAQGSHRRQEPGTIQQQLDSRRFVIRQASTPRRTHDRRSRRLDRVPGTPVPLPARHTPAFHRPRSRQWHAAGSDCPARAPRSPRSSTAAGGRARCRPTRPRPALETRPRRSRSDSSLRRRREKALVTAGATVRTDPRRQLRTPAVRCRCGASAPGIAARTSGTGRA